MNGIIPGIHKQLIWLGYSVIFIPLCELKLIGKNCSAIKPADK